jgi:hypothetical protein
MKNHIKNFNNLIKNTIFKVQNKTNNNFQISNFNKCIITFICLLFFYLFYLSIPVLYDKKWVQNNIESTLLKEFKINFNTSSDVSYRILPKPHFLIKDSKILKRNDENSSPISEIKNLKVFISQKNLFFKSKMKFENITIDSANFSLLKDDIRLLDSMNEDFSHKKIKIKNSKFFFKDSSGETVAIIKIFKALLFFDDKKLLNIFNLTGEAFNIPFTFDSRTGNDSFKNKEINIRAKKINLNFFNKSSKKNNTLINGENIISLLDSTFNTKYNLKKSLFVFKSDNSKINNSKVEYNGKLSIHPFDLSLNINLGNYKISQIFKIFNNDSILSELIKSKLLFNENVSINTSLIATSMLKKEIFQNAKINFTIISGKINFDDTKLINDKVGSLEVKRSTFFFEGDRMFFSTDILIDIKNHDELFTLLMTSKKSRKPIKKIFINLEYDFFNDLIVFNKIKVDDQKIDTSLLTIIKNYGSYEINNMNKNRRILNEFFAAYEG